LNEEISSVHNRGFSGFPGLRRPRDNSIYEK
jgi:hypothetical protein